MTSPSESSSGHIDMFRVRQKPPELPRQSFPAADVVPGYRTRGYHFVQLALVTGLFACGGLICSMLLVDGSDNAGANAEFLDGKCVSLGRSGCKAEQKWDEQDRKETESALHF